MFAYCRTKPIRSVQYLVHQSRHARRDDETSKPRIRGDASPGTALSWSCDKKPRPDYAAVFRAFKIAKGASERKGAQMGLHMLIGVSPDWVREAGNLHDPKNPRNEQLLEAARAWADTWSNGGCYAARLDLDETGGAVVDLFIAPTADQKHKSGKSKLTVSVNKALEALSIKHTGKKSKHYSALNTSWAEYARSNLDNRLKRGRTKDETGVEHIGPDQYRTMMAEAEAARDAARLAEKKAKRAHKQAEQAKEQAEAEIQKAVQIAVEAAAAVITGRLVRTDDEKWKVAQGGPDLQRLKPVFKALRPALDAVADWWSRARSLVDALPDPKAMKAELANVGDPFLAAPEDPPEDSDHGLPGV